jgi:hypothetical protein
MDQKYIILNYGISFKKGARVLVDGCPGTIVGCRGKWYRFKYDLTKKTTNVHPKWKIERMTEILQDGKPIYLLRWGISSERDTVPTIGERTETEPFCNGYITKYAKDLAERLKVGAV